MKRCTLLFLCGALSVCSLSYSEESPSTEAAKTYMLLKRPELSTLALLVEKAGLVNFFQGTGPFTVFAPSNTAFEKMDKATLESLQRPENRDSLIDLINYHVVMGEYPSNRLKSRSYKTVNGKDIEVRNENGEITVNGVKVVKADLEGPNGVAYIIDSVLKPS
jgi:uncharacterized surface protein with fasciclin (FAS1) repeats